MNKQWRLSGQMLLYFGSSGWRQTALPASGVSHPASVHSQLGIPFVLVTHLCSWSVLTKLWLHRLASHLRLPRWSCLLNSIGTPWAWSKQRTERTGWDKRKPYRWFWPDLIWAELILSPNRSWPGNLSQNAISRSALWQSRCCLLPQAASWDLPKMTSNTPLTFPQNSSDFYPSVHQHPPQSIKCRVRHR